MANLLWSPNTFCVHPFRRVTKNVEESRPHPVGANLVFAHLLGDYKDRPYFAVYLSALLSFTPSGAGRPDDRLLLCPRYVLSDFFSTLNFRIFPQELL